MKDSLSGEGNNSKFERAYLREKQARKQVEELLETKTRELFLAKDETEGIIKSLLNALFIVDSGYKIISANPAGLKLLRCEEKDVLGSHFLDFFPQTPECDYRNLITENIIKMLLNHYEETLNFTSETYVPPNIKDQLTFIIESRLLAGDQQQVPVIFSVSVLSDADDKFKGFLCVAQDISSQKESQNKITQTKNYVENIINSMVDVLIVTDSQGKIKRFNKSCEEVTSYSQAELLRKNVVDLFSKEVESVGKPFDKEMLDLIVSGMFDRTFESELINQDGKRIPVKVACSSVSYQKDGQETDRFIFVIHDVEKIKESEKEIRKARDELELTHEELKKSQMMMVQSEKMASLGQMAAGMAHEINNPIGFITSNVNSMEEYSQVFKRILNLYKNLESKLESSKNSEKINLLLKEIKSIKESDELEFILEDLEVLIKETLEGTHRVKNIIQSLKTFVHLDEGEMKDADINELLESTLKVANNEIKYKCEVKKRYGNIPKITCYPAQLNQVFMNLIINGAQAIEEKGVLTVETSLKNDSVIVKISDTGKGIKPEDKEKLFTPFFTTKDIGQGTGLGLSISHGIIEKHKGTIKVESEVGRGTTFAITIPLKTIK